jgi:hypothetical protein
VSSPAPGVESLFDRQEILPPDPDELEVLHDREYRVRAFRKDPNLLIRGAVRDQKPPRLYIEDDDAPLTIHHMQVDLEVAFPSLEIVAATVHFEMHPNDVCPVITTHYEQLVGLSIARGFTHRVRELFGGPRGCTHTTALLQAMAPVAVQCFWSMTASDAKRRAAANPNGGAGNVNFMPRTLSREERDAQWQMNLNTCHVWAEDSDWVEGIRNGEPVPPPRFATKRLEALGKDPAEWSRGMRP